MLALREDRLGRARVDDLSAVHDRDAVGDVGDDAEVVADHDHAQPELVLQLTEQVKDLRLSSHVQCGGRLVRDQEPRPQDERHRDHHALAHSARELMGERPQSLLRVGDSHVLQRLDRAAARVLPADPFVRTDDGGELVSDGEDGVERGHGVLEDHGDLLPPHATHLALIELQQGAAVQSEDAVVDPPVAAEESERAEEGDGLAGPGFADHAEGLPRAHREAHATDRGDRPVLRLEAHVQVLDAQAASILIL
jgi:hypothetical protein